MVFYLQQTVDYINSHLEDSLSLDLIAQRIGFSKFYLNHLFSVYTGYSIMEYVRKRKLEHSLYQIKVGRRILDIAVDAGYSSERAYARAVMSEYGHSPAYFRTHDWPHKRRVNVYDLSLTSDGERILSGLRPSFSGVRQALEQKGINNMKQYLSSVRYEVIGPMLVLSGTAVGSEPEDEIIARMGRLAQEMGLQVQRAFGFDSPVEGSQDAAKSRGYEYWLSVEESSLENLPDRDRFDFENTPVTVKRIPGYRYAALRVEDPFSDPFERIITGWRFLVSWLEDHDFKEPDFQHCDAHCLEEVKEAKGITVMDLYIPVEAI